MPELPEVETQVKDLCKLIVGARISEVWVGWKKTIARPSASKFTRDIRGKKILQVTRRAKYILIELSGGLTLVSHFRMTGHFRVADLADSESSKRWFILPEDPFTRVAFKISGKRVLHYSDIRKFGRLWLVPTKEVDQLKEIKKLGPEPLAKDFTPAVFQSCLRRFSGMVKPVLLNQVCIAGIGNIYADESLFDAGIHPATRVKQLSNAQLRELHGAVVANLRAGVKHGGSTVGEYVNASGKAGRHANYLRVYKQTGKPCQKIRNGKKCIGKVRRIVVAQRGTHICLACQPKLRPKSRRR